MRKNAGFMIMTLLLLTVPALANAWTLAVKVAGGTSTNNVNVAFGTTSKNFQGTSSYVYPVGDTTITDNGAASSITFDGGTVTSPYFIPAGLSGNHTLAVTYATTQTNSGLTLAQASGGAVYAMNRNNTWTSVGVSGLAPGAAVTVAIAADANHKIVGFNVGAAAGTMPMSATGAAGEVLTLSIPADLASSTVTPVFAVAGRVTATMSSPTSGMSGTAINLSVTAISDDTGLLYAYSVNGAAFTTASASSSYSFTPAAAGTYTVAAQVTTANGGSFTTPTVSIAVSNALIAVNQGCESCHSTQSPTIVNNYNASVHSNSTHSACSACHTTATPHSAGINAININNQLFYTYTSNVTGPNGPVANGAIFCTQCHNPIPHDTNLSANVTCVQCHTSANGTGGTGDAHAIQPLTCTGCHAVGQSNPFADKSLVNDNNGVRAIVGEFSKWSHHVVNANGLAVQDEQCAVCHLEGTVGTYGFGVDGTKHMTDGFVHLRNADTDADLQWDPSAPNHSTMDTFCMSCHDANGATSGMNVKLQGLITPLTGITATATNPFGDTISNRYDKMKRPAVTNVSDQFNTSNNSHHGVKGPRYSGRTRAAGLRQIASASTFANNSSALLQGVRSTIYDAGNFNALYVPLGTSAATVATTGLGDDSTLHCGDCHTVGEWKAGVATNAAGQLNTVAIGAHGSNNEYLLRNNLGTDERHTQSAYTLNSANNVVTQTNPNGAFLVCYNCHAFSKYGSTYVGTGADAGNAAGSEMNNPQSHAGEYDQDGRCNGTSNTLSFAGYTTGKATDGTQFLGRINGNGALATGEQNTGGMGNIFGIQCLNCHNSGIGNAYGGIHGSANNTSWNGVNPNASVTGGAYIDGMGNTNKVERFLPGLGNAMHVPGTLGGFTGGTTVASYSYTTTSTKGVATVNTFPAYTTGAISSDTNWEQKQWKQADSTMVINYKTGVVSGTQTALGAGCYTLGTGSNVGVINNDPNSVAGNVTAGLAGPSVTGPGGSATSLYGTWGGCEDHSAQQGAGNHGFLKRVVRPVTY